MKRTNEMSKKSKFMRTQKALAAFFTVVLMVGLFPIGMAAFGEGTTIESPEISSSVSNDDLDLPEPEAGTPEGANGIVEPAVSDGVSNDAVVISGVEDELKEEEVELVDEDIAIDVTKAQIIIQAAEPETLPAPGKMHATVEGDVQAIRVNPGDVVPTESLLRFNDGKTHALTIGEGITLNCDIEVKLTGTTPTSLLIDGKGAIKGSHTRSVIDVEGSNLVMEGNLRVYNGVGQVTNAQNQVFTNTEKAYAGLGAAGGGINIQRGGTSGKASTFEFNGGIIGTTLELRAQGGDGALANEANLGGGIFVDDGCTFNMKAGVVGYNKANAHEGGGIYYAGGPDDRPDNTSKGWYYDHQGTSGTISGGQIINNTTKTTTDWGGGGIFIRAHHKLTFNGKTFITNNTANGLGGGVSGCPHADLGLGEVTNGFALFDNTAKKETRPNNQYLYFLANAAGTGDVYAYDKDPEFSALDAMDYYCIQGSQIFGQQYDADHTDGVAYTGRVIENNAPSSLANARVTDAYDVELLKGKWLIKSNTTVGLTATSSPTTSQYNVLISGNTSNTHGGGIGCNGSIDIGEGPESIVRNNVWSFEFNKELLDGADNQISTQDYAFSFGLYTNQNCTPESKIATAKNDVKGNVVFRIDSLDYAGTEAGQTYTFWIKEDPYGDGSAINIDAKAHKVTIDVKQTVTQEKDFFQNRTITYYESQVVPGTLAFDGKTGDDKAELTITNKFKVEDGKWTPTGTKKYYGSAADPSFSFTLQAIADPINDAATKGKTLRELILTDADEPGTAASLVTEAAAQTASGEKVDPNLIIDDGKSALSITGTSGAFANFESKISFPEITYQGVGDYWYVMTENAPEGAYVDKSAYVMRVNVGLGSTIEGGPIDTYVANCISLYYYDSLGALQSEFTPMVIEEAQQVHLDGIADGISFVNFDDNLATFALSSYAVNAVTGVPVASDQRCLVDPKIYKVLEGRAMKDGEFKFSLIQVLGDYTTPDEKANTVWPEGSDIPGYVISTATNDQYGMVDFDAANNQAGEGEDPCCLLFTSPGTYHYRVIEVAGSQNDPAIDYSKEVITFTAVIEGGNGTPLVCTDMYYGHLVDGKNVRFAESEDPAWHPTMTNTSRPMELKVQKTSAWDRNEGLEGATYGLYLVSDGQNDVFLGGATSDADGWMTFRGEAIVDEATGEVTGYESLNLTTGNQYYFKEIAAPDEHTVSQFRSAYFYLTRDESSPTGYALAYSDVRNGEVILPPVNGDVELPPVVAVPAEEDVIELPDLNFEVAALDESSGEPVGDVQLTPGEIDADGTMVYTYDLDGGVFDEVTTVEVNKLEGRTHAWVVGAKLAVIHKETSETVDEWTTEMTAHSIDKTLNVNTVYILRELEAPEDYHKAKDVEFMLDEYGNLIVLSGNENGNATGDGNNTLTMFDFMVDGEMTLYEYNEREVTREDNSRGGDLVQTGDKDFPFALAIGAVAALGIAGFAIVRMRRADQRK